jgi:YfiH family protein
MNTRPASHPLGLGNEFVSQYCIQPQWAAPPNVRALQTTRLGGVSLPPFDTLNLGTRVGDQSDAVNSNRQRLLKYLPNQPLWLKQTHSATVIQATDYQLEVEADACVASSPQRVCVVMTADCLPVLFCDRAGTVVAAAHAGWRGLAQGILEATVYAMQQPAEQLMAWLGPAIGPQAFQVGDEVRQAFMQHHPAAEQAFKPDGDKWLCDLYHLARLRLKAIGLSQISGGEYCTFSDPQRFFSYRRDQQCGRMATLIWLDE